MKGVEASAQSGRRMARRRAGAPERLAVELAADGARTPAHSRVHSLPPLARVTRRAPAEGCSRQLTASNKHHLHLGSLYRLHSSVVLHGLTTSTPTVTTIDIVP
jgi:hypothetical protein